MAKMALTVTPASATLKVGESIQLVANPPSGVKWQSSNTDVATVSISGRVVAKAAGTVAIRAQKANQKTSATISVQVSEPSPTPIPPISLPPSPDGSELPPTSPIVDSAGGQWTIDAAKHVLRNGIDTTGQATSLLWLAGLIYCFGLDGNWWKWNGTNWNNVGTTKPGTTPPPEPIPIPPDTTTGALPMTVLTRSDLSYRGMFRAPRSTPMPNLEFSFSQGFIAGRPGGSTLFLSGPERGASIGGAKDLSEISIPTSGLTNDPATCATSQLLRSWDAGQVFKGEKLLNAPPHPDNNYIKITGIRLVDRGNGLELFWSYASAYGNPGEFPVIKSSILKADGTWQDYGPWGTDKGWQSSCGWIVEVPQAVRDLTGCGRYAFGAQVRGNAGSSPWGSNLHTYDHPPISQAADAMSGQSIIARTAIYHGAANPMARNTHYRYCAPVGANEAFDPVIQGCPSGQVLSASDDGAPAIPAGTPGPFPVFGTPYHLYGNGTTLDWIDSMEWIVGPNKQGVLAFGQLAETISKAHGFSRDVDYGGTDPTHCHMGYGSNPCCHGQKDPTFEANGPFAGSLVSYCWIYDSNDLVKILKGQLAPHGATPTDTIRLNGIAPGFEEQRMRKYATGGLWFDAVAKRLYVGEKMRVRDDYDFVPVIHVFDVNC